MLIRQPDGASFAHTIRCSADPGRRRSRGKAASSVEQFLVIERASEKLPQHSGLQLFLSTSPDSVPFFSIRYASFVPSKKMVSTPVRRSTRGVPLVAPSSAQYAHASSSTYSWLEPAAPNESSQDDDTEIKRYFKSFMRVSQVKSGKGNKRSAKTSGEPAIEQLKFSIGDGVLVACHGNSVGVGVLTKLWEELREVEDDEDESGDEEEGAKAQPRQEWKKQCEIRWCYRRQDLPTTMNQMRLLDVSPKLMRDAEY